MPFYAVQLQGIPVAVLRGDTLEDATNLTCNSHQTDALYELEHEGHLLWVDDVEPVLVPATLAQVGMWTVSFEAAVMRGGIDLEDVSYWMHIFGEADNDLAPYQEVLGTVKHAARARGMH
jgi:hypothetical protein